MTHASTELGAAGQPQAGTRLATGFSKALALLGRLMVLWSNRRAVYRLASLDERQLSDIGVTRADIQWALAQPWRVDPSLALGGRVERRRAAGRWARRLR